MGISVTSWFIDQLASQNVTGVRKFLVGTSDYTSRVKNYPKLSRTANKLKSINPKIGLANNDGEFNGFIDQPFTIQTSGDDTKAEIQFGFTHPTSGDELISLYTGFLRGVNYKKDKVDFLLRDRLHRLEERVVGDKDNPVDFTSLAATDIIWTITTCYGGYDTTQSSANVDIFYQSFTSLSAVVSADNIQLSARFEGEKCSKALVEIAEMADMSVWVDYDGKLYMDRFTAVTDEDTLYLESDMLDIDVNIDLDQLTNQLYVAGEYDVDSKGWGFVVTDQNSTSQSSYGKRESTIDSELTWYVNSNSALNLAARELVLRAAAPRKFTIRTSKLGLDRRIGESIRFVSSFFAITSVDAWRITDLTFMPKTGELTTTLDTTWTMQPFILDVSKLDGERLLT